MATAAAAAAAAEEEEEEEKEEEEKEEEEDEEEEQKTNLQRHLLVQRCLEQHAPVIRLGANLLVPVVQVRESVTRKRRLGLDQGAVVELLAESVQRRVNFSQLVHFGHLRLVERQAEVLQLLVEGKHLRANSS